MLIPNYSVSGVIRITQPWGILWEASLQGRSWHAACCHTGELNKPWTVHCFWAEWLIYLRIHCTLAGVCSSSPQCYLRAQAQPSCCARFMAPVVLPVSPEPNLGTDIQSAISCFCLKRKGRASTPPHLPNHGMKLCANRFFNIVQLL